VRFRCTSLSPPLITMLTNDLLRALRGTISIN
jgi:hypothetical protein